MVNLYQLLGITPAASADEIRQALAAAAQRQALPPPALQKCRDILLDADKRRQYDAQLFAAHPEVLEAAADEADTQAVTNRPWRQGVGVYADGFIDFFRFFGIDEHTDPNRIAQILTVAAQDNVDDAIMSNAKIALFDAPAIAAYARRRKAYLAARGTANRLSRRQPKNNAQPVSARIVGWTVFVLVFLVAMVLGLTQSDRTAESAAAAENTAARPTPAPKPSADMSGFTPDRRLIPSDEPNTEYYLIFYKKEAARLQTVTERRGTSGVSYAWRELDCAAGMQRYLGAGDSLDAAMVFKPDAAMSTPDADSSAGQILDFACRNV